MTVTGRTSVRRMRTGKGIREEIIARGHENITATHRTTLEITKESHLTPRGDCIIGIEADRSVGDLSDGIKERIRSGRKLTIELVLKDYGMGISFSAEGDKNLSLSHERDLVVRKSTFVCDRTLCVRSTMAARDIDREFVKLLRDRKTELIMRIYA